MSIFSHFHMQSPEDYFNDSFCDCFGGGGGDGGAAARAEAEQKKREARINSNISLIDLLFQNDPSSLNTERGTLSEEQAKLRDPFEFLTESSGFRAGPGDTIITTTPEGQFRVRRDPDFARRGEIDARLKEIGEVLPLLQGPTNQERESRVIKDVEDFFFDDLNEQKEDARRISKFELARRGGIGGSQELDTNARLQKREDDARLKIGNVALDARNNLRTQDEQARAALIDQANKGLERDVLTSNFTDTLDNTLQRSRDTAKLTRFDPFFEQAGNLFTDVELIRGNQEGRNRADRALQSFFAANPGRNFGTVRR